MRCCVHPCPLPIWQGSPDGPPPGDAQEATEPASRSVLVFLAPTIIFALMVGAWLGSGGKRCAPRGVRCLVEPRLAARFATRARR